jgi:hypothetical protein
MNSHQLKPHVARRRAQAEKICATPADYKLCGQCLSIALKGAGVCPLCRAFRFLESRDAVVLIAEYSTRFAFPVTAATVPRITGLEQPIHSSCKEACNGN